MSLYQQVSSINDTIPQTFQIQITCEVLLLNSIEYLIILKMDGLRHTNDSVSVYNVMTIFCFLCNFLRANLSPSDFVRREQNNKNTS